MKLGPDEPQGPAGLAATGAAGSGAEVGRVAVGASPPSTPASVAILNPPIIPTVKKTEAHPSTKIAMAAFASFPFFCLFRSMNLSAGKE